MTTAIFPGSFDPFTKGHLDILEQASKMFDKVIVAVAFNPEKKSFLPVEKRLLIINECVKNIQNVEIDSFDGLTVNYAEKKGANTLIRGIRNSKDLEYELELSQINKKLNGNISTIFLTPKTENIFISSSAVRELLNNNGDISAFVPQNIIKFF